MKTNKTAAFCLILSTSLSGLGINHPDAKLIEEITAKLSKKPQPVVCNMTPENTIFVFDLHGVILELLPHKALWPFCKLKNKTAFFDKLFKYFFKNKQNRKSIEGIMITDRNDADNTNNLAIINPHLPIPGTAYILESLKKLRYQIYGCSNIGELSYKYISNKFPKVFSNLIACYTSQLSQNYQTKNNKEFFEQAVKFIEQNNSFTPINIIFIDDKTANLKLAAQSDPRFYTIQFKSPKQLRTSLQNIGITV